MECDLESCACDRGDRGKRVEVVSGNRRQARTAPEGMPEAACPHLRREVPALRNHVEPFRTDEPPEAVTSEDEQMPRGVVPMPVAPEDLRRQCACVRCRHVDEPSRLESSSHARKRLTWIAQVLYDVPENDRPDRSFCNVQLL